ncbi:pentapeptide repeat-containing protein [Streptomyces sp. NPDC096057]|uniref:pentapeptide repeat-containing protein n=1 Tax=Streptomyces sp. NPDC096057 TaxID=3155543 RepID=UPI00332329B1
MGQRTKQVLLTAVVGVFVIGFALILWRGPWWFDGAHLRSKNLEPADGVVITGFRTTLVGLGVGAVAAVGLLYTHWTLTHTREKDRAQVELAREGQVTEHYVEAIKLLASDNLTQRLGGIYSLERIMRDSEKDHATVVDVLGAFVRQHAVQIDENEPDDQNKKPAEDVQAAVTVLGRRPTGAAQSQLINLNHTDLRGANLSNGNFSRVDFRGAWLQRSYLARSTLIGALLDRSALHKADFMFTDLTDTSFYQANMEEAALWQAYARGAIFSYARMRQVNLREAKLQQAAFIGARMPFASLHGADLENAVLDDADLSQAEGLEVAQLTAAQLSATSKLPSGLVGDPDIQAATRRFTGRAAQAEGA